MYRTFFKLLAVAALATVSALAAGIDGKWTATFDSARGSVTTVWELKAEGATLTGKAVSALGTRDLKEGKIDGKEVSWVEVMELQGNSIKIVCKGTLNGDELKLTRSVGQLGSATAIAKRTK